MSFDLLAPHYRWLEWATVGEKLQRCRTAFLRDLPAPRNVLIVGEGNGRFLTELLRVHPAADITSVDASARMLEAARARATAAGLNAAAVQFIHADILEWSPPPAQFDLVVTHFLLDCFRAEQLQTIIAHLAHAAAPEARWLLADFCEPSAGLAKWRARIILQTLYLFFQCATKIPATRLTPPDSFLQQSGFVLRQRHLTDWRLLHSDLWERRQTGI